MAGPVLDDHCHLDPERGQGLAAVEAFARAGGTHLLVVNLPARHLGVEPERGPDYRPVFETTEAICAEASRILAGRAWPVLGVHPTSISWLVDERGMAVEDARELMCAGLDVAAEVAAAGPAVALKSGRPHYDVPEAVWDASNAVLRHALALATEVGVACQLHTEATDDLTEVAGWAADAGLAPERVVKHYADGPVAGVTPSVIARPDAIDAAIDSGEPFLLETDYLDDPDRPGAVLGPKTVPRRTARLREAGRSAAVRRAHVDTPRRVYGVETEAAD